MIAAIYARKSKLDNAMDKVMFSLASFGAELEREKCRQRTHDAMRRKAERKEVIGCPVYGYDAVPAEDAGAGNQLRMIRRINAVESNVILRLFEQYATGTCGFVALAKQLNEEDVPPPRGHSMGWAPTCIREILRRELYRGVVVWNKTQAIVRGGKETFRKRPESEWLRIDAPELRIVPEELWQRCRTQIDRRSAQYLRHADGRLYGHPSGVDIQSRYLLVGIAQCGICGGSLGALRRGSGGGHPSYMCLIHYKRGGAKCSNALRINQLVLDCVILNGITGLLDTRILAEAVTRAAAQLRAAHGEMPAQRRALEREISHADARLQNLVNAITTGKATEAVFAELEKEEAKKKVLIGQLASLTTLHRWAELDSPRLEENLSRRMGDTRELLGRHVPQARQMLRKLIDGRVVCTPFDDHRGRGYELAATGNYVGLLGDLGMVTNGGGGGARFENAPAPETIGHDPLQSFSSQPVTEESEVDEDPIKPHRAK